MLVKRWRQGRLCALLVRMQSGTATTENSMEFPPKINNKTIIWSRAFTSGYLSEGNEITVLKRYLYPMFIAALFTIARTWKQPKCSLKNEWIKKMWWIYTMGYYSVIEKMEILPFTTTWIKMQGIMLMEISQIYKDKYCITSLTHGT